MMDKFKDQKALQKAYESLEKEFTRRSQQLRELQGKIKQGTLKEIPENAVVLTKEEHEKLNMLAEECIKWRSKYCNTNEICKKTKEVE